MTATERVAKFKQRQRDLGRRPLNAWVSPDAIRELRGLAKGQTVGDVIESLLASRRPGQTVIVRHSSPGELSLTALLETARRQAGS